MALIFTDFSTGNGCALLEICEYQEHPSVNKMTDSYIVGLIDSLLERFPQWFRQPKLGKLSPPQSLFPCLPSSLISQTESRTMLSSYFPRGKSINCPQQFYNPSYVIQMSFPLQWIGMHKYFWVSQ